jgi:hypothetical protein
MYQVLVGRYNLRLHCKKYNYTILKILKMTSGNGIGIEDGDKGIGKRIHE